MVEGVVLRGSLLLPKGAIRVRTRPSWQGVPASSVECELLLRRSGRTLPLCSDANAVWAQDRDGPKSPSIYGSLRCQTQIGKKLEATVLMLYLGFLARQGYAVLVQDTRGRFSSSGEFVPVQHAAWLSLAVLQRWLIRVRFWLGDAL